MAHEKIERFKTAVPVVTMQIRMHPDAHNVLLRLTEKNRRTIKGQIEALIIDGGKREGVSPN